MSIAPETFSDQVPGMPEHKAKPQNKNRGLDSGWTRDMGLKTHLFTLFLFILVYFFLF